MKVLVSEIANLGESFVRKTMRKYSIVDSGSEMIEFDGLIDLLQVFRFNCQLADVNELKFYLFNQGVIE